MGNATKKYCVDMPWPLEKKFTVFYSILFIKTPNNHNNDFPMVNITIFTIRVVIRKMLVS